MNGVRAMAALVAIALAASALAQSGGFTPDADDLAAAKREGAVT